MEALEHRKVDDKGRVTLGREFAGRTVQVERHEGEVVLRLARIVPENEAWLWENEAAVRLVNTGLAQARRGELTEGPDVEAAFGFADKIPDESG